MNLIILLFCIFCFKPVIPAFGVPPSDETISIPVCFDRCCFIGEVAQTEDARRRGLQGYRQLDKGRAMLFVFDANDNHCFWMKDTCIGLDMIWIDSDKRVVFIKENAQPCQQEVCPVFCPDVQARYVLEVNQGMVSAMGLKVGDRAYFEFPPPSP